MKVKSDTLVLKARKWYKTRCGEEAFIGWISNDPNKTYPIIGEIKGRESYICWTQQGEAYAGVETADDLIDYLKSKKALVSKEIEIKTIEPSPREWLYNSGTPPKGDYEVEIELRDGTRDFGQISCYYWSIEGYGGDIVRWRPYEKEPNIKLVADVSAFATIPNPTLVEVFKKEHAEIYEDMGPTGKGIISSISKYLEKYTKN